MPVQLPSSRIVKTISLITGGVQMGQTPLPFSNHSVPQNKDRLKINTPSRQWTNQPLLFSPPNPPHTPAGSAPKEAIQLAQETWGLHRHHPGGQGHHTGHEGGGPPAATTPALLRPRSVKGRAHFFQLLWWRWRWWWWWWWWWGSGYWSQKKLMSRVWIGVHLNRAAWYIVFILKCNMHLCNLRNAGLAYLKKHA